MRFKVRLAIAIVALEQIEIHDRYAKSHDTVSETHGFIT